MKLRSSDIIFGLSLGVFAALNTSAQATFVAAPTVVPQASTIFTQVYNNGGTPVSSFTGDSTQTTGGVSATANGAFQPSPNESVSASVAAGGSSSAYSVVQYYFGLNSDSPVPNGTTVDMIITASGSVSQPLASINSAQLYFGTPT